MKKQPEIKPVTFINQKGLKLFGMLHMPAESRKDVCIIILSPGIKNRVAPHRLYVKMARYFGELGFQVLRFDPEGLGDSEGEIDERFTADLYGSIQVGRFIEDTICAMNWLEKELAIKQFVLSGLCGGAITGLLAGAKDNRVTGLIGLGIPIILDGEHIDHNKFITEGELLNLHHKYIRKALSLKAWGRLLSLKSDYRVMAKSLISPYLKRRPSKDRGLHNLPLQEVASGNDKYYNKYFPWALQKMLDRSAKVLFIFSEIDRIYWTFKKKYLDNEKENSKPFEGLFEYQVIGNSNHILSFPEWQNEMLQLTEMWLLAQFPIKI